VSAAWYLCPFRGHFGGSAKGESFFTGQALHFLNGIVFGLLYGILFRELVGWKRTNGGNIGMGLLYAVIMSIISATSPVATCRSCHANVRHRAHSCDISGVA
jgi:hypothetical protein